tara:strand:- start:192 stop:863 length:672 start_codon:yes stop_codon:yes gene_type:complete
MDVIECIKTRRTVRKFMDVPIAFDVITSIIDAGRLAPTAGNLMNFKFVVVFDPGKRRAISEACLQQYWMAEAPVIIVIVSEPVVAKRFYGIRGERLYSVQNCAAAAQNMLLAANHFGLGGAWVGGFDENMVKRICGIPDEHRPQILIPIGYPDEKNPMPPKYPLENVFYFNAWRAKIKDVVVYFGWTSLKVQEALEKMKGKLGEFTDKVNQKISDIKDEIKKK